MNLRCNTELSQKLRNAYLIIDTCSIINATRARDFRNLLSEISEAGCSLFSAAPVRQEFLRHAASTEEYEESSEFLETMGIQFIGGFDQKFDTNRGITFQLAFNLYYKNKHGSNKVPSYVDMLLLFMTYYYSHDSMEVYLLTSNHHDVPGFFDRDELIVFEESKTIRTEALYKFNESYFDRKLDALLQ